LKKTTLINDSIIRAGVKIEFDNSCRVEHFN